jgi:hypothetical protein
MRFLILIMALGLLAGCASIEPEIIDDPIEPVPEAVGEKYYRIPVEDQDGNRHWIYIPCYTNNLILLNSGVKLCQ